MGRIRYFTADGTEVPAVTESQMRQVDRIAEEDFGLGVLQMMENAGRNLALTAIEMRGDDSREVVVLAGVGGNGGGGISCARHLHNNGIPVRVILSKPKEQLTGAPAAQWRILENAGLRPTKNEAAKVAIGDAGLVIDALLGYSLNGAPRGEIRRLIELTARLERRILSLDVPSGVDATSGAAPGVAVRPEKTMTLALPKTGLNPDAGDLLLTDIGIPPEVYLPLGIRFDPFFQGQYRLPLALRYS
jgi:NAD(P)H-hydrate epimerase